ncbi:carboxypeptidase-like regulatory domain-containing protein [Photobacterium sp. 1_MG-2023]|uniref:carboxypeptidase-like regulatory domain-containing protein n=1 Tax=Photobacterium sp. 1_MG-2023 TaxID=3062646 RepID=UPI0026E1B896|nr:carboxypeptidase-like regulatory domain-containing protein [Photobacterium sp. 1_MG-2023]MDO6706083.1 carboxypeptidase-like regulatory domain-containing protein [Photobacterium sp. 1_MG-2023]
MFRRIVLFFIVVFLSACGSEETYPEYPKDRQQGILSGVVFDAAVSNARVSVYEFNNGKAGRLLAATNTNPDGRFSIALTAGTTPLYLEANGGGYLDPHSKNVVTVNDRGPLKFRAYVNFVEGQNRNVMLTPLTNIAAGLAEYNFQRLGQQTAAAIESANAAVNSQYGFDVFAVQPLDISVGNYSAVATQGHQYGAFLLAYSSAAYELLEKSGGSDKEKLIYTSYNLADLQYRDIQATGQLDGWSLDEVSALPVALSFGLQKLNVEYYTNTLAQHLLRVVNNPDINISSTPASDYTPLVNRLNNASGGIYAPRAPVSIDEDAPEVVRFGNETLSGSGLVSVKVTDFIGIEYAEVFLQTKTAESGWGELENCKNGISSLCRVQSEAFDSGVRETLVVTKVNTLEIDKLSAEPVEARLVLKVADVLGNADDAQSVAFRWDNLAPVINVTSPKTFNPVNKAFYTLTGTIKDAGSVIDSATIAVNAGAPDVLNCTMQTDPETQEEVCAFTQNFDRGLFIGGQTTFFLTATDGNGNKSQAQHLILSDTTAPTQSVAFPEVAMKFFDADTGEYQDNLTQEYFQDLYGKQYLNLNYAYALQGLKGVHPEVDFADFTTLVLDQNQVPYLTLSVSDATGSSEVTSSSAEELNVIVTYEAGKIGEPVAITRTVKSNLGQLPHEVFPAPDSEGYISEARYFIPFVREIFGADFTRVDESYAQTITIVTEDGSGNLSVPYKFQFKSTFNLPSIKVTSPYIDASATIERLNASGQWASIASCKMLAVPSKTGGGTLKDTASCQTHSQFAGEIHRVTVTGSTQFYKWSQNALTEFDLTEEHGLRSYGIVGGESGDREFIITELSVFQSGFFDYLFDQSNKTQGTAQGILSDVNAMFGEQTSQFFGFNPTTTYYANNDELLAIPNPPSSKYLYRFLLEAMGDIANASAVQNSTDLAKLYYTDIVGDGKPDGKNAAGQQLYFANDPLGENYYREKLGEHFYDFVKTKFTGKVDDKVAMYYANRFAKSDPTLQSQKVFQTPAEAVDQEPPAVSLDPLASNAIQLFNKWYVSGDLSAIVNVTDPSGLDKSAQPTKLELFWGVDTESNAATPTGITANKIDNDAYAEKHQFGLDTANDYPGIARLDLLLSATDREGNSHGYNGQTKKATIFIIDNDPPKYTFIPPFKADNLPDTTYINTNFKQTLKFEVDERVGEDPAKRRFIFRNGTKERVVTQEESKSESNIVTLYLCLDTQCADDLEIPKPVHLDAGSWTLITEGADKLGNFIPATDPNVGRFRVNVDFQAPEVLDSDVELLGGNSQWSPLAVLNNGIGNVSALGEIELKLHTGAGLIDLAPCGPDCSTVPAYLLGDKANTKMQLVAANLEHGKTYTLYITARDTAYPPNEGEGTFAFKIDKMGPVIATPTLKDGTAPELSGNIMGTKFIANIASMTDDSSVENISFWQELSASEVKLVEPFKPEGLTNINIDLQKANTSLINTSEGHQIKVFVKATDKYGFESRSNAVSTYFDNEGPAITLNNFDVENDYVEPGYVFNISVQDEGTDPIKPGSVVYWTYTGTTPPPGVAGTQPTNPNEIATNMQQDFTLKINAEDIRGNLQDKATFAIQVDTTPPDASLTARYQSDNKEISPAQTITEPGTVDLYLDATDPQSGIDKVEATLFRVGTEQGETIVFSPVTGNESQRKASLNTQIANDGKYNLVVKAFNKTKVNKNSERQINTIVRPLTVQREGYSLTVLNPANFGTFTFGQSLRAEFGIQNAEGAVLNKLECWLREDYTGDGAPNNDTSGYYKVYTNTASPVCQFDNIDRNMANNPVLITRTTASNGAEVDQIFSFNMVDIDAPVIANKDNFILKKEAVDTVEGVKMLSLRLSVTDALSGMDDTASVKLLKGLKEYEPTAIQRSNGNKTITYTFTGKYDDLVREGAVEHFVKLNGLKDLAGNTILDADSTIQLLVPKAKPTIEITDRNKNGDYIDSKQVVFNIKLSLGQEASLGNIYVELGDTRYDFNAKSGEFENYGECQDDPVYRCVTFNGVLDADYLKNSVTVKTWVEDDWENVSDKFEIELGIDQAPPVIADVYSIGSDGNGNVLMNFDISDEASGLNSVKYIVKDLGDSFTIEKSSTDDDIHQLAFESAKLGSKNSFRVYIEAEDNVGMDDKTEFTVNILKPQATLELLGAQKKDSNIVLANNTQTFNISTVTDPNSRAEVKGYVVTLDPQAEGLSPITLTGTFNGLTTATEIATLTESMQGPYHLKLSILDNLGRSLPSYTLKGESSPVTISPLIVDMARPNILNVQVVQQAVMPTVDGKYTIRLTANIQDANLNSTKVVATLNGGTNPSDYTKPAEASGVYTFDFKAAVGTHDLMIKATDYAGNEVSTPYTDFVVEPWTVPEVTSFVANDKVIGGAKRTTLEINFSEEITDLSVDDFIATATVGGNHGYFENVREGYYNTWEVDYISPTGVDTEVMIQLKDGSYIAKDDGMPGKGSTVSLSVFDSPLIKSIEYISGSNKVSQYNMVTIKITFSRTIHGSVNYISSGGSFTRKDWESNDTVAILDYYAKSIGTYQIGIGEYYDKYGKTGPDATISVEVIN